MRSVLVTTEPSTPARQVTAPHALSWEIHATNHWTKLTFPYKIWHFLTLSKTCVQLVALGRGTPQLCPGEDDPILQRTVCSSPYF